MQVVRALGVEIAYERAGSGPALVFVHGAACDSRIWEPQMEALADEFTVVAWDEPGAGRSSDVPSDFRLEDYAACLAAVIEDVGRRAAHVAGLSWGSTVALELYRRRPELVASLILADGYAGWKGSLPAKEVDARVAGVQAMLAAPPGEFDPTLPGLVAEDPPVDCMRLLEETGADARRDSMRTALTLLAEADLTDVLPQIAVPTLLIWGESDARSPLSVADDFQAAIPTADLVVIPRAGHMSNLEQPEAFNEAIRRFLRELPEPR